MSLRFAFAALLLALAGCASSGSGLRIPNLPLEARTRPEDFVLVTVHNEPAVLSTRAGATVRGYDATAAYVVTSEARHTVAALSHEYGLREVAGWPIDPLHVHCVVFRRPASVTVEALLARLERDPRVRLAQPLQTFATLSSYNDPYATLQTSLVSLAVGEAHRWSQGAGVRIAVIDTGVSVDHPDLAGSIIEKHNFVDDDSGGFARDLHGTEVAGVIAARANNHIGIVGIAPQAELIALKACWLTADSPHAVCNSFTLAQALTAAVQSRARIVNLSLAGPADPLLAQIVAWGISRGVLFVGAVAPSGRAEGFPAGVPGVIAVDRTSAISRDPHIVYAPGDQVLTLTPSAHYDFASGSSIATAHVTGLLALLLARRNLAAEPARALLVSTSLALMPGAPTSINACSALAALILRNTCSALMAADPGRAHDFGAVGVFAGP